MGPGWLTLGMFPAAAAISLSIRMLEENLDHSRNASARRQPLAPQQFYFGQLER
jgi:hypothetical protein